MSEAVFIRSAAECTTWRWQAPVWNMDPVVMNGATIEEALRDSRNTLLAASRIHGRVISVRVTLLNQGDPDLPQASLEAVIESADGTRKTANFLLIDGSVQGVPVHGLRIDLLD